MALKGIVEGSNYKFNAANKTITFSSDYIGMSLSDITYITNIKSGVATVIYDPFDSTKGGVLNGLVLTLAYNTTSMSDSDPIQIIVGYTPKNADPQLVKIVEGPDQQDDTALLQNISDNLDYLNLALDQTEGIQVNTRDVSIKKDIQGAIIPSDAATPIPISLKYLNDYIVIDTAGYSSLGVQLTNIGGATITIQIQGTNDASVSTSTQMWTPIPATQQQNNAVTTPTLSGYGITSSSIYTFQVSCVLRFVRIFISNYTSGIISGTAYLRTAPSVLGGSITPAINVLQIASSTPNMIAGTSTSPSSGIATSGGIPTSGGYVPTVNPTNANSTLATTVPNPLGIGGREQPYVGALSGIFRYVTVDGGGRYILGGDVASTATPFQSTKADGSVPSIPPRGIGGIPNNSQGSQSLTTSDTSQVEGDTNTMLLKQILIELKINNQQLIEFAKSINTGNITLSDPQEYRDDSTFQ